MTNLPEAVSELIGREAELRDAMGLVTRHRLVTLIGAGGIGKTRLGLEVARHLLPRFPDGVFVAEFGTLSGPDLVPDMVEGVLLIKRGEGAAGSRLLRAALTALPEGALYLNRSLFAELAEGLGAAGQIPEGLAVVDNALARVERTEEGWCRPELLRQKGELLLLRGAAEAVADAEGCFRQALDVAGHQDALSWELRAATSLARLWREQRRTSQARDLLAPVYRRFTEGFGTSDLVVAKAFLGSLR